MRRTAAILALIASALVATALAVSAEAKSKSKQSVITKVSPMRATPGTTLTVRGRNFSSSRKRNTVIFKGASGRVTLVKPRKASHRKLVVVVPGAAERLITRAGGVPKPTRMRLRVVVNRRNGKLSLRRNSPLVLSRGSTGCLSEYPDVCVPDDGRDYDCVDIPEKDFSVPGEDPMGFDGDDDKAGCESKASKGCRSEYPDVCVPDDGRDYDCVDIDRKDFSVPGEDPMRFDDNDDKVGCESS